MINLDEKSNAHAWELEVSCKNRKIRDEFVAAILSEGCIEFEVRSCDDVMGNHEGEIDGHYTILSWCHWIHNLHSLTGKFLEIEKKYEFQ
jgi:hypothetical protein